MLRRLPPLNALRAFEAAARALSFTRAAAELGVTPAAVSHQIKALEAHVGGPLFRRLTRALILTDAGQAALPALRDGFDRLADGVERMRAHEATGELRVSAAPTFAARWLLPRLGRFNAAHPDIDIRIDATAQVVDLSRDGVDLAIRYGPGEYAGMRADRLLADDTVVPVCGPALCAALRTPADLAGQTLLHVDWGGQATSWPDWEMWLKAAGVAGVDATRGPVFGQEDMAMRAAADGQGVALASTMLSAGDLAAGRLVRPFALALPVDFDYFVVAPEATADRPKTRAFRDWLLAEAGNLE